MIKLKDLLYEGLSPILYHYTGLGSLRNILKQNKMRLSVAFGTPSDLKANVNKLYFLSLSRIKFGGYARSEFYEKNPAATIVFDGRKFGTKYKGTPIDYWGPEWRDSSFKNKDLDRFLKNTENEDRLVSDKDEIPNIKKYIKEVHVYVPQGEITGRRATEIKEIDKLYKPIYYYLSPNDFKVLNKRKATTNIKDINLGKSEKEEPGYKREKRDLYEIKPLLDIYNSKDLNNLNDRAQQMISTLWRTGGSENSMYFSDTKTGVENEVHNYKNDDMYRDQIRELGRVIRKTKSRNIKDLLHYLIRKIWKIKETPEDYKDLLSRVYPEIYKKEFPND